MLLRRGLVSSFPFSRAVMERVVKTQDLKKMPPWRRKVPPAPGDLHLKYPPKHDPLPPSPFPSGWMPPLGGTEDLPFRVERTKSKVLPVYSDFKGGNRRLTVLRKISGDVKELGEEIRRYFKGAVDVRMRLGRIELKGDHCNELRIWLRKHGF
eukprot:gnl/Hemi2/5892_TR2039_c0_g1_i1.p2 gnl/Hemi2/5892_TR2039_c0_g1~~gnl/Hemi2/5892_TR2039_c0_g1_i1.p2  ORF type:complete len:153 (+),score=24.70 gnl/Hemi2/5892_TR2039_c0_g1_i1:173-631(+)